MNEGALVEGVVGARMERHRQSTEAKTLQSKGSCKQAGSSPSEEWSARVRRLQDALTVCPTDILARCELAAVLEELGQADEALSNWKAVLACDPNNLKAWEGMARCRQRSVVRHSDR